MANFVPLKSYMLFLMDACVKKYAVQPPFLDAGCGKGDVSLHFAKQGWHGKAVDNSSHAVTYAKEALSSFSKVQVANENLLYETETYNCIFLLDVLEHQEDDERMMKKISKITKPGGFLFLTVPVHTEEWGWDDEFYGHYRRYKMDEAQSIFLQNGFELRETLNLTYPFFWLLRKFYLRAFPRKMMHGTPEERTQISAMQNAYGENIFLNVVSLKAFWLPMLYIQHLLKNTTRGFELLFVAQKK